MNEYHYEIILYGDQFARISFFARQRSFKDSNSEIRFPNFDYVLLFYLECVNYLLLYINKM